MVTSLNARGDPLRRGAAADVEEVGGLAAGELDHVHGRHGEPGAVDDAADVALQPDIGQAAVGGLGLARVLLRLVAQLGDLRPAEQGVVVEAHLGVERQDAPFLGDDQRVDLDHGGVELAEGAVAAEDGADGRGDLAGLEAQREGELARLEALHADGGLDRDPDQRLGLVVRDLLDLHAAGRGGHDHDPLGLAVEHEAQIELAPPLHRRLDIDPRHQLAARPGLLGHQRLAEQLLGRGLDLAVVPAQLDAAGLAAPAGMDLRLDHPGLAADLARPVGRLLGAVGEPAARDGHAEPGEQLLRLIFVNVQCRLPTTRCDVLCVISGRSGQPRTGGRALSLG